MIILTPKKLKSNRQLIYIKNTLIILLSLIIFHHISFVECGRTDKQELYRKYPSLKNSQQSQCHLKLSEYLINFRSFPYDQMFMYSGQNVNQLGDYHECQYNIENKTDFTLLSFNVSHLPLTIYLGACMPKECTQDEYDIFKRGFNNLFTRTYLKIQETTLVESDVIKNWTRVEMNIAKTKEEIEDWKEETLIGFYSCIIFLILFLLLFSIIPCLIHSFSKIQESIHHSKSIKIGETQNYNKESNGEMNLKSIYNQNNKLEDEAFYIQSFHSEVKYQECGNVDANVDRMAKVSTMIEPGSIFIKKNKEQIQVKKINNYQEAINLKSINIANYEQVYQTPQKYQQTENEYGFDQTLGPKTKSTKDTIEISGNIIIDKISTFEMIKEGIQQFSWISAFEDLKRTRRREWDHEELDMLEYFKFLSYTHIQMVASSFYMFCGPSINLWRIMSYLSNFFFTVIINGSNPMEIFLFFSAFLGTYRLLQVQEARGGYFTFKDSMKLIGRKLVRLIPMYYLTLFFGWAMTSRFFEGPLWAHQKRLYFACDRYWWTQLLFIGNYYPFYGEATMGCMYWSWFIQGDVQMFVLIPVYLAIYRKSKKVSIIFMSLLMMMSVGICMQQTYEYNLKAGSFALENFHLFSTLFNKPYVKFPFHCSGVMFGIFYIEVLKYRRASDEVKKNHYRKINFMVKSQLFGKCLFGFGLMLAVFISFNGYEAIKNSYTWSRDENAIYMAFNRPAFIFGNIMIYLALILGHFEKQRQLLNNDLVRALGKITYAGALLCPLVVNLSLLCQDDAIQLRFFGVIYIGMGNQAALTIVCFIVYILFEYPFKYLSSITINRYLSHDELLKSYYDQLNQKTLSTINLRQQEEHRMSSENIIKNFE
ncbi:UNKNOWN [Stylonychia lemnae]|uniref:Acyltransferase 3 domain-containing protein n=1 Tax=Stylonychia lemnae TaxID=5949 RepID=A0A078A6Z1_STYLE|nr:UNKNOWN [Stylonychia lemnae]|eukprot:CDW76528.1 UNKNOWN [Stylonychia lemnae]